ncbi:hypothetical protein K435DRAFT_814387 [Dendrothele bispora CBS 962.96]|uniref:Uncharacterized protein n=1 Tax=Dendrothele bispora (strain CBS 962.96) TaxID=1314807 RepID=A0A4V4HAH5_DENBC|nr:hypothetical protein K435DRAFT_814387 [Dendrothele bispora CBS 962.96]
MTSATSNRTVINTIDSAVIVEPEQGHLSTPDDPSMMTVTNEDEAQAVSPNAGPSVNTMFNDSYNHVFENSVLSSVGGDKTETNVTIDHIAGDAIIHISPGDVATVHINSNVLSKTVLQQDASSQPDNGHHTNNGASHSLGSERNTLSTSVGINNHSAVLQKRLLPAESKGSIALARINPVIQVHRPKKVKAREVSKRLLSLMKTRLSILLIECW